MFASVNPGRLPEQVLAFGIEALGRLESTHCTLSRTGPVILPILASILQGFNMPKTPHCPALTPLERSPSTSI